MDGIVRQDLAVNAVIGRSRNRANQVRRVYVLDISVFEAFLDLAFQPWPHIFQNGVAAEICLDVTRHQDFLHQASDSPLGRAGKYCIYRVLHWVKHPRLFPAVLNTSRASAYT